MTKQNFIAKALCSLGGDRYTRESTESSLQDTFQEAQKNAIPIDLRNDKWILFSDLHKGAKNRADDFRLCEKAYITAADRLLVQHPLHRLENPPRPRQDHLYLVGKPI